MTDIKKLTFVQGCDLVWVELDGKAIWFENSWGYFDQFVRFSIGDLGPVVLEFRQAEDDEEPVWPGKTELLDPDDVEFLSDNSELY